MTYALGFMTLWTCTYAIGPCMNYIELLLVFETHLDLFETFYGYTYCNVLKTLSFLIDMFGFIE